MCDEETFGWLKCFAILVVVLSVLWLVFVLVNSAIEERPVSRRVLMGGALVLGDTVWRVDESTQN